MNLVIKVILLIVLLGIVSLFVLKGQDKEPLMTVSDLKQPDMGVSGVIERLPEVRIPFSGDAEKTDSAPDGASGKTSIYSWRDEDGNVHFTNEPPEDGQGSVKTIEVDPNINVMPAVKGEEPE